MVGASRITTRQAPSKLSRRARNMREKQDRIFEAATELFAEHGFDAVTTQAISDRADVAAGTLFRYAASKGELLLMVYNEAFRQAVLTGTAAAEGITDPADAVYTMAAPILDVARSHPENATVYQRELLFGPASDGYRAAGLALVTEFESAIAARLREAAGESAADSEQATADALRAARTVFAVIHLLVVQPSTGVHRGADPNLELRIQVAQVVRGYLATVS